MKKISNWGWKIVLVIGLVAMACNLPAAATQAPGVPTLSPQDVASTAASIAMTGSAGDNAAEATPQSSPTTGPAPTVQSSETPCFAMITTNTNANVRTGPGVAYDIVGAIPTGGTARVAGQNDAKSWWYIEFAGGYAWIAGSVTTSSCVPATLQIVAAPPLPTAPPPTPVPPTAVVPTVAPPVAKPDLYVSEYSWSPDPPHMGVSFHVRVGAYNQGNAASGPFTVQWWLSTSAPAPACTWNVASMAAHGGRILECDYTPGGWANYPSQVVVDSGNTVDESDEGNNTLSQTLPIKP